MPTSFHLKVIFPVWPMQLFYGGKLVSFGLEQRRRIIKLLFYSDKVGDTENKCNVVLRELKFPRDERNIVNGKEECKLSYKIITQGGW